MKNLLLTGASGFIGTNLINKLNKYRIFPLDLKLGKDILTSDLPDNIDYVIHLAALAGVRDSFTRAQEFYNTNVTGSKRILEKYPNARILVASSSNAKYGYSNPYAMTKRVMEDIPHNNRLNMRFTTVYGEDSREGMFFNLLKTGKLKYTTTHVRDFIHVEDLCNIIVSLIEEDIKGTIGIGTGVGVNVYDLAPHLPITDGEPYEVHDNTNDFKWPNCRSVWDFLEDVQWKRKN